MPSDATDKTEPAPTPSAPRGTAAFWLVLALCLATRLPFLTAGYGNDPDAWALVHAAKLIDANGEYAASRLPGYPLSEFACSLLSRGGPLAVNLCTALLSVAAAAFFGLSLKRLGSPDHLLAALALALTPVVFINSTNAMDYVWALAFILAAHHFALLGRPLVAGLLLGGAVACRVTSGVMLLPLGLLIATDTSRLNRLSRAASFGLAMVLVAALVYWPVAATYGPGFLSFRRTPTYPDAIIVSSRATLYVWGPVGLLGIALGVLVSLARRLARRAATSRHACSEAGVPPSDAGKMPLIAALVSIVFYAAIYFRLPLESGYLIPAVPFVLLLLNRFLTRRAFQFVCAALCLAPYVGYLSGAGSGPPWTYSDRTVTFAVAGRPFALDPLRGPVLHDYAERLHGMAFVDRILHAAQTLPADSVIVVGYWLPQIQVRLESESPAGARFIYLLDAAALNRCRAGGTAVYYLPEMAAFNREADAVDLRRAGAIPLDLYWRR
jgi:hypothetical protein